MNVLVNGFTAAAVKGLVATLSDNAAVSHLYWIRDEAVPITGAAVDTTVTRIDHQTALLGSTDQLPAITEEIYWSQTVLDLYTALKPTVLKMQDRLDRYGPARSYADREATYRRVFTYWYRFLIDRQIGFFVGSNVPHEVTDFVLAELCRVLGIPTLYFYQWTPDVVLPMADYREMGSIHAQPASQLAEHDRALRRRVADRVRLQQTGQLDSNPFYMDKAKIRQQKRRRERHWWQRAVGKVRQDWRRLLTRSGLHYAYYLTVEKQLLVGRRDRRAKQAYTRQATTTPDLSRPYIYLPLHYQPEATTSPLGGIYVDQYLMADVLLAAFPPDVHLYVKEHPAQGFVGRGEDYYRLFDNSSGRLHFIATDYSSAALQANSLAVATVSGTAGFEAIWQGIPVLLFGDIYYASGPGVYRIHTIEEAEVAAAVLRQHTGPSTPSTGAAAFTEKLFERLLPANIGDYYHHNSVEGLTPDHNARVLATEILACLHAPA